MNRISFYNICIVLTLLTLGTGCSTVRTLVGDSQEHATLVYSGISLNNMYWHCGLYDKYPYEPNWPGNPLLIPYFSLDYVFSFMADTVLIPYSIYAKNKDGSEYFQKIECSELKPYFGKW
tara:strand:+ start:136 stop:495 length:360 start_codon:yes stop_codon:yes gene_type:complete